jgi:hypothetical protein
VTSATDMLAAALPTHLTEVTAQPPDIFNGGGLILPGSE